MSTNTLSAIEMVQSEITTLQAERDALRAQLDATAFVGKPVTGLTHSRLAQLITIAATRQPIMLVGPAGTGKTTAAAQIAEALGLPFYPMSVGAQTSKSDLLGYKSATGAYVDTIFRQAYEHGGVFLLDEIDSGNSNVLTILNAALSNGACSFPDGIVNRHDDFVPIAAANTYGQGASRQYVGRNQLDAATLDRFVMVPFEIDAKLEQSLAGSSDYGKRWLKVVRKCREFVESEGIRTLVTPRATIKGVTLLNAGVPFDDVLEMTMLAGLNQDKKPYVAQLAQDTWEPPKPKPEPIPAGNDTTEGESAEAEGNAKGDKADANSSDPAEAGTTGAGSDTQNGNGAMGDANPDYTMPVTGSGDNGILTVLTESPF